MTRTRADRSAKYQERNNGSLSETVVKATLYSCIANTPTNDGSSYKVTIRNAIKERVLAFSTRIHAASLGLTHLVKEMYQDVDDVSSKSIPSCFVDITFIRQLMLGTQDARKPDPHVARLHASYPEYFVDLPRHCGDRNIYSAGAKKYETNLKNHLRLNFDRFLRRSLNARGLSFEEKSWTVARVYGFPEKISRDYDATNVVRHTELCNLVQKHRRVLGLDSKTIVTDKWLDSPKSLPSLMRYFVFLNREIEDVHNSIPSADVFQKQKVKKLLFNVVPLCSIRAACITIDTSAMYGILSELGYVGKIAHKHVTDPDIREALWNSFLDVGRMRKSRGERNFTGTIETDGVTVCVHYTQNNKKTVCRDDKEEKEEEERSYIVDKDDYVVGVDPGAKDIVTVALPKEKECKRGGETTFKRLTLSRARYYKESGIFTANKRSQKWSSGKDIRDALIDLSTTSAKGSDFYAFRQYVNAYENNKKVLWGEYTKGRWANQRMRLYGGKKRSFSRFLNEIQTVKDFMRDEKRGKIVIAYGSGRFPPSGPGRKSAPVTRAFKEFSNRYESYLIDEYRTTWVHHRTGEVLQAVRSRNKRKMVRGLLWCGSTMRSRSKHFLNRDMNAAINIRNCMANGTRPECLTRTPDKEAINKSVVGREIAR